MSRKEIIEILRGITHPATGADIVSAGWVTTVESSPEGICITLAFPKHPDPFSGSIRRKIIGQITRHHPLLEGKIEVAVTEPTSKNAPQPATASASGPLPVVGVDRVIAVASGKGGVGKSTVAANIAVALYRLGYRVGMLDADIYGPSMPKMFGLEGYVPPVVREGEQEWIVPAESHGIKVVSIGFFINLDDALIWRGPMAAGALKQMIRQTQWGALDFLVADLPPGTGDIHLTLLQELRVDGAVIVSTPQQVALADVLRNLRMFRTPHIAVPVLGMIENMAWFTPAELPQHRYYIFGSGGTAKLAQEEGVPLLGEIPILQSVMEGAESGFPAVLENSEAGGIYMEIARKIVAGFIRVCS